jgi:DNA-binding CsgD family transcriptional regulator
LVCSLLKGGVKYHKGMAKDQINALLETEVWNHISVRLKTLLLSMTPIVRLSEGIVTTLIAGDDGLLAELRALDSYVSFDSHRKTYEIHDLFHEFLHTHENELSEDARKSALKTAAEWCVQNGMKYDAIRYYCGFDDFEQAARVIITMHMQVEPKTAKMILEAFNRATEEYCVESLYFPVMRMRQMLSLGLINETIKLAHREIVLFLADMNAHLDDKEIVAKNNRKISYDYIGIAIGRHLLGAIDGVFDFAQHYKACYDYYKKSPYTVYGPSSVHATCSYAAWVGANRKGAVDDYIKELHIAIPYTVASQCGYMSGLEELTQGEQLYFQNSFIKARNKLNAAAERAANHGQHSIRNKALLYSMLISLKEGNKEEADKYLTLIEEQMSEPNYQIRLLSFDIAKAFYYLELDMPEQVPISMQEGYEKCTFGVFKENLVNHMKMRYSYHKENYDGVILYEDFACEAVIYGKIEWLKYQSLSYFKQDELNKAVVALEAAYELAAPNGYILSFIEAGDDMIGLIQAAAVKTNIPKEWLEMIKKRATEFADTHLRMLNRLQTGVDDTVLTPKEHSILLEAGKGVNRDELAKRYYLSRRTIDRIISGVFDKLGAKNILEALEAMKRKKLI